MIQIGTNGELLWSDYYLRLPVGGFSAVVKTEGSSISFGATLGKSALFMVEKELSMYRLSYKDENNTYFVAVDPLGTVYGSLQRNDGVWFSAPPLPVPIVGKGPVPREVWNQCCLVYSQGTYGVGLDLETGTLKRAHVLGDGCCNLLASLTFIPAIDMGLPCTCAGDCSCECSSLDSVEFEVEINHDRMWLKLNRKNKNGDDVTIKDFDFELHNLCKGREFYIKWGKKTGSNVPNEVVVDGSFESFGTKNTFSRKVPTPNELDTELIHRMGLIAGWDPTIILRTKKH